MCFRPNAVMKAVKCPNCATVNPNVAKECRKCHKPMPTPEVPCPSCGELNPMTNKVCQHCGYGGK